MIDGYFAYSFTLGLAATVNPCGFVLLPTYLMYYLGLEGNRPGTQRAGVQRALLVSGAVSLGAVSVFVVVGAISHAFTSVIEDNVKYAGFAIGIALVVLGCFLLAGWKPRFALPQVNAGAERRQTFVSMFGFGVTYAVASIGCTIGLLVSAVFGSFTRDSFVAGVLSVGLYGAGMALVITALTVTLSFASGGFLRFLRRAMQYIDRAAALFVMATGFYLTWYWWAAISDRTGSDGLTSRVESWNAELGDLINRAGPWRMLVILAVPVIAAIAVLLVGRRRRSRDAATSS